MDMMRRLNLLHTLTFLGGGGWKHVMNGRLLVEQFGPLLRFLRSDLFTSLYNRLMNSSLRTSYDTSSKRTDSNSVIVSTDISDVISSKATRRGAGPTTLNSTDQQALHSSSILAGVNITGSYQLCDYIKLSYREGYRQYINRGAFYEVLQGANKSVFKVTQIARFGKVNINKHTSSTVVVVGGFRFVKCGNDKSTKCDVFKNASEPIVWLRPSNVFRPLHLIYDVESKYIYNDFFIK
jgi:hypothetical protein